MFYVSIFSLSWALLIFFNKLAMNAGVQALPYTIQTTIVTVLLLLFYNLILRKKELLKIKIKDLKSLLIIGLIVGAAYITGFYGLKLSTAINYGFLAKSTLLFTVFLAYFFLGEKISRKKLGFLIAFVLGIYFLSTGGQKIIPRIGDLLALFTAFCYSSAVIITKTLTKKIHSDVISLGRVGFALLFLLAAAPVLKINFLEIIAAANVMIVGFLGAVLALSLNKTIFIASASYLTMMSMMVPVITAFLGLVFLKESINLIQIIGAVLILASGVLVEKSKI